MLQAAHAQELADLKAKQQLEIKQAEHSSCKHQAATAALKKELNHLKHKLAAKHSQDKEPVLISAQVSNNADVQVCVRLEQPCLAKDIAIYSSIPTMHLAY